MRTLVAVACVGLALAGAATADAARARWDTRLVATVPSPGYPAHAYVHPNGRIYEGTYSNPRGDNSPSQIFEYTRSGTLLRSWTMPGQDLSEDHGIQVATSDARGRLVVFDHSPPRAVLFDTNAGRFIPYATFKTSSGQQVIPNYGAWGPDGSLYVTDYGGSGTIFRVPPGGGAATPWLTDPRLSAPEFATTGITLAADQRTLFVAQQTSPVSGHPYTGSVYEVPIQPDGRPGPLHDLWNSQAMDLPDGLAIARSGRIYVATPGRNQIIVLDPAGHELERFPKLLLTGDNGSSTPFDTLDSVAFSGTSLITASESFLAGDPSHWAIHDVETREPGLPELIPANAGIRPGERAVLGTRKKARRHRRHHQRHRSRR